MNYRRMLIFSILVLLALGIPGLLLAVMLGWDSRSFGPNPEQAGANFRFIEGVATAVTASLTYVWFLWPVTKRLATHSLIVFLVVEVILSFAGWAIEGSPVDAFVWQAFLRDAMYAAIGLMIVAGWRVVSRKSSA